MPQPEKIKRVEDLCQTLEGAKSIFMTDFSGLSVEDITKLRRELRKVDVNFVVVKNTLAKLSAEKVGLEKMTDFLVGPTGLAIANGDPIAPVRVIYDFQKQKKKPTIKAAVLEGKFLDQEAAEAVRNIPTRDELIAQVVGTIAAPLSGFVCGLNSMLTKLVYTLDQVKEKKQES